METEKETDKTRERKTEKEIRLLLSQDRGSAVSLSRELFTPAVFTQVKGNAREGIGAYYPVYKDGSCAEAVIVKFRYAKSENKDVVILERANKSEIQEYDKERLRHLLRAVR